MALKIETYHDLSNHQLHNCCQKTSPTGEVFVPLMVSALFCARRRWTVKVQRNLNGHGWPRMETWKETWNPSPADCFDLFADWLTNLLTHWLTDSLTKNGCCVAWQVSISIQKSCCFLSASEQLASALSWGSRLGTDTLRQPSTTWWSVVGHSCRVRLSRDAGKTWPPPEFLQLAKGFESFFGGGVTQNIPDVLNLTQRHLDQTKKASAEVFECRHDDIIYIYIS